jgi:hypothetical protein
MSQKYKVILIDAAILFAISGIIATLMFFGQKALQTKQKAPNPMITSIVQSNFEKVKENMSSNNTDLNNTDDYSRTPLMWTCYSNMRSKENLKNVEKSRIDILKFLLEKGADMNLKDSDGWTALTWCSWSGMDTMIQMMTETGKADINIPDKKGQTALMIASIRGNDEVVRILLEKGADRDLKSNEGKTALDIASEYMNKYSDKKSNYEKIISSLQTVVKVEEPKPAEEPQAAEEEKPATEVPAEQKAE